jgi:hypothetical protein
MGLTVDDLVARAEITDVIQRLARGTDRLDEELMASCYHPDGYDDHNAFRGSGAEFAAWVPEALASFAETMHFVGLPHIRLDGDTAQCDTYCVAHHISHPDEDGNATDMVLGLRYVDRFEKREGEWRIAKRVCAFDWVYDVAHNRNETTLLGPDGAFFPEDYTVGARSRDDITYRGV